ILLFDPERDRGPSDFDVRHVFSGALTYEVPALGGPRAVETVLRGWSVDLIVRAASGSPVNVSSLRVTPFGSFQLRPDLVPGQAFYLDDPAVPGGRRFNGAAFVVPTEVRQGTTGRNALRGFGFSQVDLAVGRRFQLWPKLRLQFRGELFNLLNHPN